jgi:hypothetical protein
MYEYIIVYIVLSLIIIIKIIYFFVGNIFSIFFSCTIGGHKKLGQTSNLYKVKIQKYTLCKFGFLQIRL